MDKDGVQYGNGINGPLNPFPTTWFESGFEGRIGGNDTTGMQIETAPILTVIFFVAFAVWTIYTLIAAYHWFRYGHRSWLAVPMLALHLFISGFCILYAASGIV